MGRRERPRAQPGSEVVGPSRELALVSPRGSGLVTRCTPGASGPAEASAAARPLSSLREWLRPTRVAVLMCFTRAACCPV